MERIEQKMLMRIFVYQSNLSDEMVAIEQFDNGMRETTIHYIEKSSIPQLIEALKKYSK